MHVRSARAAISSLLIFAAALVSPMAQACNGPAYLIFDGEPAPIMEGIGKAHMPIRTTSPKTQELFDQGLALLHGFWLTEALRSFETATQYDRDCVMCYWGIIMSWPGDERRDQARAELDRLQQAMDDQEKLYVAAALVNEEGEFTGVKGNLMLQTTAAYRQAMRALVQQFPEDAEARSLLGLALIQGNNPDLTPLPETEEAIELLRPVLQEQPNHLGALHYLVHALEGGPFADQQEALDASKRLQRLAPKNAHLMHMAGHIYANVGDYAAAAAAYKSAEVADFEYLESRKKPLDFGGSPLGHNVHTLASALSFGGDVVGAKQAVDEILRLTEADQRNSRTRLEAEMALIRIRVDHQEWSEILDDDVKSDFKIVQDWGHLARGLALVHQGDAVSAELEFAQLEDAAKYWEAGPADKSSLAQSYTQIRTSIGLKTAVNHLKGEIAITRGHTADGLELLKQALAAELDLGWAIPPAYIVPMDRELGDVYVGLKRWDEATAMYRHSLARFPNDAVAMRSLAILPNLTNQ